MNEKELKAKVNALRREVEKKQKTLRELYGQLKTHKAEAGKHRNLRNQYNTETKETAAEIKSAREERTRLNQEVVALKKQHKKLVTQIRKYSTKIKESKEQRNRLNKDARGTDEILRERYVHVLSTLMNAEIPLKEEIRLYDQFFQLRDRLEIAEKATDLHNFVLSTYATLKETHRELDRLSAEIDSKSRKADEYHSKVTALYEQIKTTREKSDGQHKKVLEEYEHMKPIYERIEAVKAEIAVVQEEMAPHAEKLEEIRSAREEEKKAQAASEVKEKLASKKRVSFDDFRVLLEKDGLPESSEGESRESAAE